MGAVKRKWILLALAGLLVATAIGQQQRASLSGKSALNILGQKFGADKFHWIVEMRGFNGVPQPREWSVVVYDSASIYLLNEYWVGEGRAVNEGPYDEIYPDKAPIGYIDFSKLKLGSVAAFTVAEGAARKARVGFDSLNYVLRSREYSTEPVWILALIDADQRLVGKVHVSGVSGSVLRSIWINREGPTPKVIDSAAPGNMQPETGATGSSGQSGTTGQLYPSSKPKKEAVKVQEQRTRGSEQ